jgi:hypothetical protein
LALKIGVLGQSSLSVAFAFFNLIDIIEKLEQRECFVSAREQAI